jgi:hypothetical protein
MFRCISDDVCHRMANGKPQNRAPNPNHAGRGARPAAGVVYVLDQRQTAGGLEQQVEGADASIQAESAAAVTQGAQELPPQVEPLFNLGRAAFLMV